MPAVGWILRGSISSAHDSDNIDDIRPAVVRIVINGQVTDNEISKPNGVFSHTDVFNPPIRLAQMIVSIFRRLVTLPMLLIL